MFKIFHRFSVIATPLLLVLFIFPAHSADIGRKIRQGQDASLAFELGFQAGLIDIPIVGWESEDPDDPSGGVLELGIIFDARAQWKRFFAEINSNSFSNLAFGYSALSTDTMSLDILVSEGLGSYEPSIGAFDSVRNRSSDLVAGLRNTHHLDDTLFQFELFSDVSGKHDGQMAAVQLGKFRQYRNWNLHALASARYFTGNMVDYYFGISAEESNMQIPQYEAKGGTLGSVEIGATLPLNEKWIFKSTAEALYLPDSVVDSPLSDGRIGGILSSSISYVF